MCLLDHREVYVYEKLRNGFQNGYTILDSHQQCVRDQVQFQSLLHGRCMTAFLTFPFHLWGIKTSFREGNGNPLQYSCLENPMDGGAW